MGILIFILATFGLAFLIRESDGPWGIIAWARNQLMKSKYVGAFFYDLLACYFCLGFHCGWIIYLLQEKEFSWQFLILRALTGGVICLILDGVLTWLHASSSK